MLSSRAARQNGQVEANDRTSGQERIVRSLIPKKFNPPCGCSRALGARMLTCHATAKHLHVRCTLLLMPKAPTLKSAQGVPRGCRSINAGAPLYAPQNLGIAREHPPSDLEVESPFLLLFKHLRNVRFAAIGLPGPGQVWPAERRLSPRARLPSFHAAEPATSTAALLEDFRGLEPIAQKPPVESPIFF